jgi:hypothetical protein
LTGRSSANSGRGSRARRARRPPRTVEQAVAFGLQRIAFRPEEVPEIARQRAQPALIERQAIGKGIGWLAGVRGRCGFWGHRSAKQAYNRVEKGSRFVD